MHRHWIMWILASLNKFPKIPLSLTLSPLVYSYSFECLFLLGYLSHYPTIYVLAFPFFCGPLSRYTKVLSACLSFILFTRPRHFILKTFMVTIYYVLCTCYTARYCISFAINFFHLWAHILYVVLFFPEISVIIYIYIYREIERERGGVRARDKSLGAWKRLWSAQRYLTNQKSHCIEIFTHSSHRWYWYKRKYNPKAPFKEERNIFIANCSVKRNWFSHI